MEILEGDGGQTVVGFTPRVGYPLKADSLKVRVTDRNGMPVPGAFVGWTTSAGAVSPLMVATDSSGVAAAEWDVYDPEKGYVAFGAHTVTAAIYAAGSVTFTVYARVGVMAHSLSITPDHVNVDSSDAL